jgi:hypothetical protein
MSQDRDDGQDNVYSLEEILAEYSSRKPRPDAVPLTPAPPAGPEGEEPDLPWPEPPQPNKVISFPGAHGQEEEEPEDDPAGQPSPETPESPGDAPPDETGPEEAGEPPEDPAQAAEEGAAEDQAEPETVPDNLVAFPRRRDPLSRLMGEISRRLDRYADRMYAEEGVETSEATRRAEELIPGVDEEEYGPGAPRRRRREPPPPPDTPPQELFRRYSKGLKGLHARGLLMLPLCLVQLYLMLADALPALPLPPVLSDAFQLRVWLSAGLLAAGMLLGADVVLRALANLFRLSMGLDTLAVLGCFATLADALTMTVLDSRGERLPFCGVCSVALLCLARGAWYKRRGLRLACRTAASAARPYLVTLDEGKWNGRDTYTKWQGAAAGFGSQIQREDGAQRVYRLVAPLLLLAALLFSLISSLGRQRPEHLLWCLSATLTAAGAFSALLVYGKPFFAVTRRLASSGAALAGWTGVSRSRRGAGILLTDTDLFPPGSVGLNGIKVFGNYSVDKVVAYAATLIRDWGSGLDRVFHDLLRAQGATYRRAERLCCYEGGGLSANIRGDQVLVGSAAFMNLMEVALPQGLNIKNAVFCAIDGELAGIFALNYDLPGAVPPALSALLHNRVGPVLAVRDFNIIPAMLRQRFRLPADRMEYPPVERRRELSDPDQPHSDALFAVLCREGLAPFTEAVVGGKRLRLAVRLGAALSCVGCVCGLLLTFYLTFVDAYSSLNALSLLIFMLLWLVPAYLVAGWVNQY